MTVNLSKRVSNQPNKKRISPLIPIQYIIIYNKCNHMINPLYKIKGMPAPHYRLWFTEICLHSNFDQFKSTN